MLPPKNLKLIVASIAENEPLIRKRIELELNAHHSGQSINGFS